MRESKNIQGRIQEFWLGGGVKVVGRAVTNQPAKLIYFEVAKPRFLDCSFSGVSKKWSAIFVQCIVQGILLLFLRVACMSCTTLQCYFRGGAYAPSAPLWIRHCSQYKEMEASSYRRKNMNTL